MEPLSIFLTVLTVTFVHCQSSNNPPPKIDSCSYTFNIPGSQIRPTCESRELEQAIEALQKQNQQFRTENQKLQEELKETQKQYDRLSGVVTEIKEQTDKWREAINMPNFQPLFKPAGTEPVRNIVPEPVAKDCQDAFDKGFTKPGIYTIRPSGSDYSFQVYCDDGWTVLQRRMDGSQAFFRDWEDYLAGFGNLSTEYWLGLESMHFLTSQQDYQLRIEAQGWTNKWYCAVYDTFKVANEAARYKLTIDSATTHNYRDGMVYFNGKAFSTFDRDHDTWYSGNCAQRYQGGWWYHNCGSNINQRWGKGVGLIQWSDIYVKKTMMKIKPLSRAKNEPGPPCR